MVLHELDSMHSTSKSQNRVYYFCLQSNYFYGVQHYFSVAWIIFVCLNYLLVCFVLQLFSCSNYFLCAWISFQIPQVCVKSKRSYGKYISQLCAGANPLWWKRNIILTVDHLNWQIKVIQPLIWIKYSKAGMH